MAMLRRLRPLRRLHSRLYREGGFTLTELLICMTLVGTILFGLTEGIMIAFRTLSASSDSYAESADTSLAARYFAADAASTFLAPQAPGGPAVAFSGTPTCTDPAPTGAVQLQVEFAWTDSK